VKQGQTSVKKLARLLEIAAKKNTTKAPMPLAQSPPCLDRPDRDLSDEMFDSIFHEMSELAHVPWIENRSTSERHSN
jgi:hypothetical protein